MCNCYSCGTIGTKSSGFFCLGGTQAIKGLTGRLDLKSSSSETPISPARLFEVVADDLLTLNKNLQSVSSTFEMHAVSCSTI